MPCEKLKTSYFDGVNKFATAPVFIFLYFSGVCFANPDGDNIDIVTIWDFGKHLGIVDAHRITTSGRCENLMAISKSINMVIAFTNSKCLTLDSQVNVMTDKHGTKIARVTSGLDMGTGTPHPPIRPIDDVRYYYVAYITKERR